MKYDDYTWHAEGDYPEGVAPEAAMTHIGMFLGWAVDNGLEGDFLREECAADLARFRAREITGAELLGRCCDGKLTDEDLNATGNEFAAAYYEKDYFDDYADLCGGDDREDDGKSVYGVPDTWENFKRVSARIGMRYEVWAAKKSRKGMRWGIWKKQR